MSHLKRFAVLVVLGLGALVGARAATTVLSIELIGIVHEDNPRVWASRPVIHQDPLVCLECHEGMYNGWAAEAHQVVTCEDCHGSARGHVTAARRNEPSYFPLADGKDLCLVCHLDVVGRPEDFPVIEPEHHPSDLQEVFGSCTSCHTPHNPAYPPAFVHSLEGREICLVCHGPDKWKPYPPSHAERDGDTCLRCHEESTELSEEGES